MRRSVEVAKKMLWQLHDDEFTPPAQLWQMPPPQRLRLIHSRVAYLAKSELRAAAQALRA